MTRAAWVWGLTPPMWGLAAAAVAALLVMLVRRGPASGSAFGKDGLKEVLRGRMSNRGLFDLSGKVAIVVGGASGIGEAVTIGAVAQGARVVCLDVKEDEARSVAARRPPMRAWMRRRARRARSIFATARR